MEKPINLKSKGYGNLGPGNPKDLAKAHGKEELELAKDAQGNETGWECPKEWKMGQGSSEAMKWVKEAQNNTSTSLMIILGYWNLVKGKHIIGPKKARQAQVK